ncbi:MAG TPA: M3 family metallopeptidase, partial [Candidatus Pelethenecus sp.]|nr:M3 family metallopeptidase [Candidatus Pelethenecus sp.]
TSLYKEGSFILLNHNNNLDSAFTIAHEAGHSIHSLYSNEHQEKVNANYTIFVAEIASTFNEQLFLDYVMQHSSSKAEKIVVLQQAIDNIVATFYRQTLFANYEILAHEKVENKEPITAEILSDIMTDLYNVYYGLDLNREPLKKNVWAYIPHFFHTPFYVYQYAT